MPRTIDHAERRRRIGEAVWRIVLRDGVGGVSLRTVATEADLVLGSLRHSFATKADLLADAMLLAAEQAGPRIGRHDDEPDPLRRLRAVLHELLPLDDQRTVEMRVHLALMAESPAHPRLAELADRIDTALRGVCTQGLHALADADRLAPGTDLPLAAATLHGLLDGLALHTSRDPSRREEAVAVLDAHLAQLTARG